MRQPSHISVNY